MFSFRTTPIADQPDRCLIQGRVGCFCTPNCFDVTTGKYLFDIFAERGNLARVFAPSQSELSKMGCHITFSQEELEELDAVVVEIQDVGSRYFGFTRDVMRLLSVRARMVEGPSIYIVDHFNPAGRIVEGSMPAVESDIWTPKVAHRHGLTLGELANLYVGEIDAKYPLHVISAFASPSNRVLLPWMIAPAADIPGMFTCLMYSGGSLWNKTSICPGIGTTRPYEVFGAPYLHNDTAALPPAPEGVVLRPCSFVPSEGIYAGQKCFGYQIILSEGEQYHSLLHTLRLMRYFAEHYSQFEITPQLLSKVADPVIEEYLKGGITFDIVQEHVKAEEQKWIRKAKRYVLYDDVPVRIK
ncbi:MAG: DUF1343 domain-containing protein [Bacteroidales bacterium]|nr:DUF1343 domain-containing protein [Candidatus Cryptobacteroides aphodequi]